MIAVSSCLAGINCTYRGDSNLIEEIKNLVDKNEIILICPEILGGLTTPRLPSERNGNRVINNQGIDVSEEFKLGAKKALALLQENNVDLVLLKGRSPSCGKDYIYDGTFSHTIIKGDGVTTALLKKHEIMVYNENEIDLFFEEIKKRGYKI